MVEEQEERAIAQRERCPKCHSKNFHINHYLKEHHHGRIYLECADCGEFTARIVVHAYVDPDPYYHFLQGAQKRKEESSRKVMDNFQKHSERAVHQAAHVKELLDQSKDVPETRTIRELYYDYRIIEDG